VVPPYLCAIAYDDVGCDVKDWKRPLEIAEVSEQNLSRLWGKFR
jgi:hypothetical protein